METGKLGRTHLNVKPVHHRQVQQMQVPVVSSVDSWKRKKTRFLLKLKEDVTGFLVFFTPWRKSLQKIGGAHINFVNRQSLHVVLNLDMRCNTGTLSLQGTLEVVSTLTFCFCGFWWCSILFPSC